MRAPRLTTMVLALAGGLGDLPAVYAAVVIGRSFSSDGSYRGMSIVSDDSYWIRSSRGKSTTVEVKSSTSGIAGKLAVGGVVVSGIAGLAYGFLDRLAATLVEGLYVYERDSGATACVQVSVSNSFHTARVAVSDDVRRCVVDQMTVAITNHGYLGGDDFVNCPYTCDGNAAGYYRMKVSSLPQGDYHKLFFNMALTSLLTYVNQTGVLPTSSRNVKRLDIINPPGRAECAFEPSYKLDTIGELDFAVTGPVSVECGLFKDVDYT
ncbi:hypothetical protein DCS_05963 [Drechmeria coniospora]|uniref:Uncharacterized protein n=1 Tax=Drechmeria coniospora TaxID=98403 RepID=A0A151GA94_DRECN|nr:hypothetical protein DCS_05963 [Drechmeria coniospora]KYK54013.1 hypothetical protein DCS_05963 [Drechmeria coniospora]ODA78245.1 hypothetical protein RJ55_05626 [Drechmeria coniospora]